MHEFKRLLRDTRNSNLYAAYFRNLPFRIFESRLVVGCKTHRDTGATVLKRAILKWPVFSKSHRGILVQGG